MVPFVNYLYLKKYFFYLFIKQFIYIKNNYNLNYNVFDNKERSEHKTILYYFKLGRH